MQVSTRFLSLLHFQLAQFADRPDVRSLVVYVTQTRRPGRRRWYRLAIGQAMAKRPATGGSGQSAAPASRGAPLAAPAASSVLLGALQVETHSVPWPEALSQRLQAVAVCLTEALCLDLEQQRLAESLRVQNEQLGVLVHQLRNPLAALRTFGQLLLRRLETDNPNRPLVEGLLAERAPTQPLCGCH
jgi:signal transduction histidine kinase